MIRALPEPVDLALFVNVQGLMVNPRDYFQRLRAALEPGGRVAIIATRTDSPFGAPAANQRGRARITINRAWPPFAITRHSTLAPVALMIFANFAASARMNAVNASGVLLIASSPIVA